MPTRKRVATVGIGATTENLLDGSIFETVSAVGQFIFAAVSSVSDLDIEIHIGSELAMELSELDVGTTVVLPDNLLVQERVTLGDKLTVRATNRNAAAADVHYTVSVP